MSGPGLNQPDAHHAIHQAAFHEAEQLTLLLRRALRAGDQQQALQVAATLIEHWQTRTLRHAEAEETGWYRDVVAARPERENDIVALTRDHDILRILLNEIQGILPAQGIGSGVVERFEAMLLLNAIHSREEERRLLGEEHLAEEPGRALGTEDVPGGIPGPAEAPGTTLSSVTTESHRDVNDGPIPLAVARPALHARLVEHLRQRGLGPADILADLRADPAGQTFLHVAYGREHTQTMEWTLEADTTTEAGEAMLQQIADACEQATQADYRDRMRTPHV